MTQEKEINVNQVNYGVYEAIIKACFADYQNSFNQMNPERQVVFNMTIMPMKLKAHDIMKKQKPDITDDELKKYKNDEIEVRYLRVGKFFNRLSYHTPIREEFKPGFIYQQLNVVDETWEEEEFQEGDIISETLLEQNEIRVEKGTREKEITIYQQSMRLETQKEVLNDKWWKRILYMDLLNTLMAKGVEYGEALELIKRSEEEKAVLANELGESAKQVLEANKIVIRAEMPKPLSEGDKQYKAQMDIARDKENKK
jgi:hypothetical protein